MGWEEMAAAVTRVWRGLPPAQRERAGILGTNYGRAGAVDFYGGQALPPAIAPVGSYWFWGPGEPPPDVLVVVGAERAEALPYFRSAVEVMRLQRPWGVPEERDVPVVVARDPIRPLSEVWPEWAGQN